MTRELQADAETRRRALEPATSFLVEAPAGSGKTELLIQRYLRLLGVASQPESLVALTFTRKAAAEMKERVLNALRDAAAAESDQVAEHARITRELARAALERSEQRGWNLLEDSARLEIGTIDSFCSLLTRQMPLLSGFGSNPDVIENAAELHRLAARRAIMQMAESPEFRNTFRDLALHFDGDLAMIEKLTAALLGKRDQWNRNLAAGTAELRKDIDTLLEREVRHRIHRARFLFPPALRQHSPLHPDSIELWRELADRLLLKEKKEYRQKYAGVLENQLEFCDALHECREAPPLQLSETQARVISNFMTLLHVSLFELEGVFRDCAKVDFTRIAEAAVAALGALEAPSELAYRLDFHIEHLLIDEFQDTSRVQYDLLERLTAQWSLGDGRSLFLVGDPMQSIYRFRDAEVGLFLKTKERGIGSVQLETLRLGANFRSTPAIVRWVNRVFERVAGQEDNIARGQVRVRTATAARTEKGPEPKLHAFVDDEQGLAEAARVVEIVRETIARRAGSIAILVRARSHLAEILPALRAARIEYEAVELDALTGEQHVMDLLSLTKAVHQVADRLSWFACLRAPFCGLTLADLLLLAEERERTILERLNDEDVLVRLSADGRSRVYRFRSVLNRAVDFHGRHPVRDVVESAWLAIGGPAVLTEPNHREDAAAYFDLLEEADSGGRIADFSLFETRLEYLFARPKRHAGPHVQVMTIHKAKGLQFDTVIVPHLDGKSRPSDRDLLVWTGRVDADGIEEFLFAGLPQRAADNEADERYYRFVNRENGERDKAEEKRLFYVATTRAKDALHLLANVKPKASETGVCKPGGGFLRHIWDVEGVQDQFLKELERQQRLQSAQQNLLLVSEPPANLRRLPAWWTIPVPEPAVRAGAVLVTDTPSAHPPVYEWVSETGRHVGIIVHDLLRRMAEEGVSRWSTARVEALRPFVNRELERAGVSSSEREQAEGRVLAALRTVLESERGRWTLEAHGGAESECALAGMVGERLETARIDRTFVDENGVRWIIDYKTSTHEGSGRAEFLAGQKERYRAQLETYGRLLQLAGDPRVAVGLYFPLLDEWISWEMVAEPETTAAR